MSKGLGFAVAGLAAAAVVAGVVLLSGEAGDRHGEPGATVSTSKAAPEQAPGFAAADASAPPSIAPLAVTAEQPVPASGASAALAAPGKPARPAGAPVTLTGRVIDEAARPVAGAKVSFASDPLAFGFGRSLSGWRRGEHEKHAQLPQAETDRDGRFTLQGEMPPPMEGEGLPFGPAQAQLIVQQDAFATLVQPVLSLQPPQHDVGDLPLTAGTWVTGRAVDENGRPLAGAHITARNVDDEGHDRSYLAMPLLGGLYEGLDEATTGGDGRFRLAGLQPGKADVTVRAEGRRLAVVTDVALAPRAPSDVGDVALVPGQTIAGLVVDDAGQAIANAEVSLSSMARLIVNRIEDLPRGQIGQEFGQRAQTGPDGRFEISGLAGGHYTVHVRADGFERLSREDVAAGTLDLRLAPVRLGGLFVQIVNDRDSTPVPGARIKARAIPQEGPFGRFGTDDTLPVITGAEALAAAGQQGDPAGAYFVRNAAREGTRLVVAADGFATLEVDGPKVESGAIGTTSVRLVPESVVAGHVLRPDGTPIADARLTLAVKQADAEDDDSPFLGGRRRFMRNMRLSDEEPDAELDAAHLSTKSHPDGSFELHGVAPGEWELSASHPDCVDSKPLALTLAAGESDRSLEVTLQPAGSIAGLVTEADGTPAPDVEITVTPSEEAKAGQAEDEDVTVSIGRMLQIDDGTSRRYARTEPDGTYRVGGLAEGEYQVTLSSGARQARRMGGGMVFAFAGERGPAAEGQTVWSKVVPGVEARADFVRPRRGSITGRVVAGGRPVSDTPVHLRNAPRPGDFQLPGFGGDEERTDDRGDFHFDDVEAGEYELSAHVPGAALERTVPVKLEPGASRSADIVFGGATLAGRVIDKDSGAGVPGVTLTVVPVKDDAGDQPQVSMSIAMIAVDGGGGPGGMTMEFGGGQAQLVRSGEEGRFELLYLEPGRYKIEASGAGYTRAEIGPLEVEEGQNKDDLHIDVARGAIVHGTVTSDQTGQKLDAVPVRIENADTRQMTVTQDGAFRFEGLEPGKYTVTVLGSGFGSEFGMGGDALVSEEVEVDAGEVREMDLRTKS